MTMKEKTTTLLTVALLAAPLWAGGDYYKKCTAETTACITEMVERLSQRGWIGIEWDSEQEGGPVLTQIVSDSPAERAGLEKGDRLLAFNEIPTDAGEKAVWAEAKKSLIPGNTITLTVERNGEKKVIDVELVPIPRPMLAQWIGNHVIEHHLAEKAPDEGEDEKDTESPRP